MPSTGSRTQQISRVPYLPGLDGLRALAVIAVIVYHANPSWLPGGFLGVEVFFVISGYLITLLLVAEHERDDSVDLRAFWARRARRLLPALFVMMALLVVWSAFFERDALGALRGDVIAGALYGSNWFQVWIGAGYTAVNDFAPLRHLWSLAVEEQFYVIWPVVMLIVLRAGRQRLPRVAMWFAGIAFAIAVAVALLMPSGPIGTCVETPNSFWTIGDRCISKVDLLYLSTPTRATGLLLGAALALVWRPFALLRGPMRKKGPLLDPLALIGLLGLMFLAWNSKILKLKGEEGLHADPLLFRGGLFLTGLLTLLLISAVAHQKAFSGRILGTTALRVIGERSYGLYLFHWPVFQALRHEAGIALQLHEFIGAMAVTVVITEISYRYVELPIRERRFRESMQSLLRSGPGALRRRGAFGVLSATIVAVPAFSVVSLASAELKPNLVQATLDEAEGVVIDVLDEVTAVTSSTSVPSTTTAPASNTSVAPEATTTTSTTTTVPPPLYEVFALGDSVMKGAAPVLAERGIVVDAEESRQGKLAAEIFVQLRDLGVRMNVAVVHVGTNGPMSNETLDLMMSALQEVPRVIVLTGRGNRDWIDPNNFRIRSLPERYPNVVVLDWQLVSELCSGKCFAGDGIHLDRDGRTFYADQISLALASD
ncbi:MAG: acyltransferase family protein [Ilumatobacteraceae bacterium]|jgi:peptidoglycan/LPS O-acetylase OafA/YrhL|nr:acyltransferase [Acidimicrobiia bacterium]